MQDSRSQLASCFWVSNATRVWISLALTTREKRPVCLRLAVSVSVSCSATSWCTPSLALKPSTATDGAGEGGAETRKRDAIRMSMDLDRLVSALDRAVQHAQALARLN